MLIQKATNGSVIRLSFDLDFKKNRIQRCFLLITKTDEAMEMSGIIHELSTPYGTKIYFQKGIGILIMTLS